MTARSCDTYCNTNIFNVVSTNMYVSNSKEN